MGKLVEKARIYASKAHEGQKYGEEFPYFMHLLMAYNVARSFDITDEHILAAVWCHDVLEDTDRTYDDLAAFTSDGVAQIVQLVSDPKQGTRKERHAVAYPMIAKNKDARIVKLCDRISHVEIGGKKVGMYRREHVAFKQALGSPLTEVEEQMWEYLDFLLMGILPNYSSDAK